MNYLKVEGNNNLVLQGISGSEINLNKISEVVQVLERAEREELLKLKEEVNTHFEALKKHNQLAIETLKLKLEGIITSKNTVSGGISNNMASVIVGDGNNNTTNNYYHAQSENFSIEKKRVFFVDKMDRVDEVKAVLGMLKSKRVFYYKTDYRHQPDWLLERVKMEILSQNAKGECNFQIYEVRINAKELDFEKIKDNILGETKGLDLEAKGDDKTTHCLFLELPNVPKKNEKSLLTIEDKLFKFWSETIKREDCKLFISVGWTSRFPSLSLIFSKSYPKFVGFYQTLEKITETHVSDFLRENTNSAVSIDRKIHNEFIADVWRFLQPKMNECYGCYLETILNANQKNLKKPC